MLFYLTDSLLGAGEGEKENVCRAISNLLTGYDEGNHLLLGDLGILQWAREMYGNFHPHYGLLTHLIQNYSTNTVPVDIEEYVKVVKGEKNKVMEDGKDVYEIPYERFLKSAITQPVTIIAEDEEDGNFYQHICSWYKLKNQITLNTTFKNKAGGGKHIDHEVTTQQAANNLFVCITDTDEKYPRAGVGKTCDDCEQIAYYEPLEMHYRLSVHEIENIVPRSILFSLAGCNNNLQVKSAYESIWDNIPEEPDEYWRYVDLKSGINKTQDFHTDENWKSFAEKVFNSNACRQKDFGEHYAALAMKAQIMPGLSKKILKESVAHMNSLGENEFRNLSGFKTFQEEEWMKIGKLLLNKGACGSSEAHNF
ncbi:MAG: hypothetical protein NC453_12445 [Muribaculum sp.]|nr:hypothetical protein [Muribaculum sp.]